MLFKSKNEEQEPKVAITYTLEATLKESSERSLETEELFMVREHISYEARVKAESKTALTYYCCCAQGDAGMSANIPKFVFTPDETLKAVIDIDNSECK